MHQQKILRANNEPYVCKCMRKAIMKGLNKLRNFENVQLRKIVEKQKNYCSKLYNRERRKFYSNLDLKQKSQTMINFGAQ